MVSGLLTRRVFGPSAQHWTRRLSQTVDDGFQKAKPADRTVLALLDFSRAYDKVWRADLLDCMLKKGIHPRLVRWVKGFLSGRRARVRVNSTYSQWHSFQEGVPQGSVLAPLLFLFVIDCLRSRLPEGVFVSLFADDLALWASSPDKEEASSKVELAVSEVAKWSRQKKLELNISKCLVSFFSANHHEARWQPRVVVEGEVLGFDPTPTFLGVTYDLQLTFVACFL